MKVLLCSIGSRGDVQPILALALELRALGHNASLCVAPTRERLTVNAIVRALRECLRPETTARAQTLASSIEPHGARIAAERLANEFG